MKEYIENVIAPRIKGDGGWVEFVSYEKGNLLLIFRGECSKCIVLDRCCTWIEQEVKRNLDKDVKVIGRRVRPFFWDVN